MVPEKSSTAAASTSQINKTPHDPTLEAITLMAPMFVDQPILAPIFLDSSFC
ncbi:hypothetical protein PSHT_14953 [Puccinia striiformis]|uniref:Uncharacterized protein n=1 Tax=Puccinia striiformis TaxID=27350 RepID=A0A2S4UHT4_9BASI|nr:hypothetical protein PSHT_14953 [Puccinia striiformis]